MTQRQAVTPGVIDKDRVDISLSGGIDTRNRQEFVDWTKYWTTLENVVNDDDNCYVKRSGVANVPGTTVDDSGTSYLPLYRAARSRNGAAFIGNGFGFYSVKSDGVPVKCGYAPELAPTETYVVGANGYGQLSLISGGNQDTSGPAVASEIGSKYSFTAWAIQDTGAGVYDYVIVVVDRKSKTCIRTYKITDIAIFAGGGSSPSTLNMCLVDDRYLHVYFTYSTAGNAAGKFFQIDSNSLPASISAVTLQTLAAQQTSTTVVNACVAYSGGSAVVTTVNVNNKINVEKFSTAGTTVANADVASFKGNDVATDGTTLYITGYETVGGFVCTKKVTISSLAVASTVTEGFAPTALGFGNNDQRIAVDASGNCMWVRTVSTTSVNASGSAFYTEVYSLASGAGNSTLKCSIPNYLHYASPFYHRVTGKFYLPAVSKRVSMNGATSTYNTTGYSVILDITSLTTTGWVRPVAVLDEYTARNTCVMGATHAYHAGKYDSGTTVTIALCVEYKATSTSRGYSVSEIEALRPDFYSSSDDVLSGGATTYFDSYENGELGILSAPSVFVADSTVAGGPGAGIYNYFAVYEYVDASGQSHYSLSSDVTSIAMATNNKISVQVTWNNVTARLRPYTCVAKIYRTKVGGTQYYLVDTVNVRASSSSPYFSTYTDAITDATLASRPQPYRQPGTLGTALDRYCPPASAHACRHKDRMWVCRNNNLYYSSFFVDGEAYWFNPQFSIPVYGGSGRITAIASMDGQLVVFKKDAIFLVDGDGPPENGGSGTEFSPARRINTEFGCVDPRSVVATPDGIMYRSHRGIEMLTRSMQIVWAGERVQNTVNSYPYTGGAVFDRNRGRVYVCMYTTESSSGVANTAGDGVVLMYDTTSDSWFVNKYVDGKAVQDVGFAPYPGAVNPPFRLFFLKGSSGVLWHQYGATKLDAGSWVSMKLESGWIKLGMQERIKVSDLFILAKRITDHALTVSVAYDYSPTYSFSRTFQPNEINAMTLEQLVFQVPEPDKQAVRFKIEDSPPNATTGSPYTYSTGSGCEIMAVTVNIGKRGGGPKLPATQKV